MRLCEAKKEGYAHQSVRIHLSLHVATFPISESLACYAKLETCKARCRILVHLTSTIYTHRYIYIYSVVFSFHIPQYETIYPKGSERRLLNPPHQSKPRQADAEIPKLRPTEFQLSLIRGIFTKSFYFYHTYIFSNFK